MHLSEEQIRTYREEGFIVCPSLVPRNLVERLNQELDELAEKAVALANGREQMSWSEYYGREAAHAWGAICFKDYYRPGMENCRIYKIQEAMEFCPAAREIALCPELSTPVKDLIGEEIGVNHSKVQFKEALTGPPQPFHQDSWYFECADLDVLTAVVYLDDANVENGALQVLKRSHRLGILHHDAGVLNDPKADISKASVCEGKAGSVVLFHSLCAHGSDRNPSPKRRRGLVLHYYPQALIWGIEGDRHDATFVPIPAGSGA
jgi:hypothetical protein